MYNEKKSKYHLPIFSKIENDISLIKKPIIVGVNGVDASGKTEFSRCAMYMSIEN